MRRLLSIVAVLVTVVLVACGSTKPAKPRTPLVHRAERLACEPRTHPDPDGTYPTAACQRNADCTHGLNGRCVSEGTAYSACVYDACNVDTDCGAGRACVCGEGDKANACSSGDCSVDAECGAQFCSPAILLQWACVPYVAYFCHTESDECVDDNECPQTGRGRVCNYQRALGHWACGAPICNG
jgi:hypothetical protein